MALNTFANLKQAIERWSKRTDLSDVIDDIVSLAENRIDNRLRVSVNNKRATATAPTSDRFLALPDYFIEMRRFTLIKDTYYNELIFNTPESMILFNQSGVPKYYTITSEIEFDRVPADGYTLEMSYWKKLTPLSDSNTTNDVLTNFPHIYLQACKVEAHYWARDEDTGLAEEQRLNFLIDEANAEDLRGRYGAAPRMQANRATP